MPSWIRQAGDRLILLVTLCAAHSILSDYSRARERAMNALRPEPFEYLKNTFEQHQKPQLYKLKLYISYYTALTHFYPQEFPEAYGLLGYSYAQAGDLDRAANYYKKALALNNTFFGYYYNLGIIAYSQGRLDDARQLFIQARSCDPRLSVAFVFSSQSMYLPLWFSDGSADGREELIENLKAGYQQASKPSPSMTMELF